MTASDREKDLGLQFVDDMFSLLQIDDDWSVKEERGFSWWPHTLRQRVWVTRGRDDDGIVLHRAFVVTDAVRNCRSAQTVVDEALSPLGSLASGSAAIFEAKEGTVRLWSAMTVHEQVAGWMSRLLGFFATMQAIEAETRAPDLAALVGGELDASAHPRSGTRADPDNMLSLLDTIVRPRGRGASPWAGSSEMTNLRDMLNEGDCFATGDENGLTAELPFGQGTSMLRIVADDPHPELGSGVGLVLHAPLWGTASEAAAIVGALNRSETSPRATSHLLGSWCSKRVGADWLPAFATFLPSAVYQPGLLSNIAVSAVTRAMWARDLLDMSGERRRVVDVVGERVRRLEAMMGTQGARTSADPSDGEQPVAPSDIDDSETERCPLCGKDVRVEVCGHHLATFDLTFADEGMFRIGLVGGSLFEVGEIGEVFTAASEDYGAARYAGSTHDRAVPAWCVGEPALEAYLANFEEVDLDASDYDEVDDFAHDLRASATGCDDIVRDAIDGWLRQLRIAFEVTETEDEPGPYASAYLNWWCQTPAIVAAKLSRRLRRVLEKRPAARA